jgi:NADH-quinone oxidoreductase subunit L
MFLGMGVLAPQAGMFHLTTHAFFKALMFLAAGSVMHAMHDVIDMRRLGGLAGPLRWTALGFLVGGLALAGVPPFAGFFSKDLILEQAFEYGRHGGSLLVWSAALATAFVTAVYMTRAMILTFAAPASHHEHPPFDHALGRHEAPPSMAWPIAVLALLSFAGGLLGAAIAGRPLLNYLEIFFGIEREAVPPNLALTGVSVAAGLAGIAVGLAVYRGRRQVSLGAVGQFLGRQWFIETLYEWVIVAPAKRFAWLMADVVELRGIDGIVGGVAGLVGRAGAGLRRLQTGYVRNYAAAILAGTILVLGYWLLR